MIERWDAVLKLPSRRSTHHVDRSGLEHDGHQLSLLLIRLEAHSRRGEQRDADYGPELRGVAMPSDRRAGWILSHHSLRQSFGRESRDGGRAIADYEQELWERIGWRCRLRSEVIAHSIARDAALGNESVVIVSLERQSGEAAC